MPYCEGRHDPDEARAHYQRAVRIKRRRLGAHHREVIALEGAVADR